MRIHCVGLLLVTAFAIPTAGCGILQSERDMTTSGNILDQQLVEFSTMLAVRDLSRSEEFYVRNFGFRVTERLDSLRRLQRPGVSLYLVTRSPPTIDKPGVTLAPISDGMQPPVNLIFRVHDVRTTHASLRTLGVSFLAPPTQPPWGGWRAFAQDPDGYLIEIEQP